MMMIFNKQYAQVGGWQSLTIPEGKPITIEAHPNFETDDPIVYVSVGDVQMTAYSCRFDVHNTAVSL